MKHDNRVYRVLIELSTGIQLQRSLFRFVVVLLQLGLEKVFGSWVEKRWRGVHQNNARRLAKTRFHWHDGPRPDAPP